MLAASAGDVEKQSFLTEAVILKIVLCVILSLLYLGFVIFVFHDEFLYLLGLPLILFSFLNPDWVCRGLMLPHFVGYRQLIFAVANIIGFIFLYHSKLPHFLAFVIYTANTIFSFLIVISFITPKLKLPIKLVDFKNSTPSKLLKRTSFYFYGFILNNINYTAGVILLDIFLDSQAAGSYSSYYNIFTNLVTPVVITYNLFAPKIDGITDKALFKKYYATMCYILLGGCLFFLNFKFFYTLFYPSSFTFQPQVTVVVALVFAFYCLEYLFVINSIFYRQPKSYFLINLFGIVINIVGNFYFIYTHQFSVRNSFICLLLSQVVMSAVGINRWPKTIFFFPLKDLCFCLFSLLIVLFIYFHLPVICASVISVLILSVATFRVVSLLKNLY